jgi:hypothetical protein
MEYLDNYKEWINPLWRELALELNGQARPKDWPPAYITETAEYTKAHAAGYDLTATNWWVFEEKDLGITINPPWTKGEYHWWITKMYPGQFMPIHIDPHTNHRECLRYWMPLQDYHPGHIFVYDKQLAVDYKLGDLFLFSDSKAYHGAANIGHIPRVMLMVTEYVL